MLFDAAQNNNVYGLIIIQEHPNRPGQERSVTRKQWGQRTVRNLKNKCLGCQNPTAFK